MNLILLGCLLILASLDVRGQQEPMFTQYMFNTVAVNPAYAGTRNTLNLTSLSRLQWLGLEGSPKTYSVALHTPINKKKIGVGFEFGLRDNKQEAVNYAIGQLPADFVGETPDFDNVDNKLQTYWLLGLHYKF